MQESGRGTTALEYDDDMKAISVILLHVRDEGYIVCNVVVDI